MENGLPPYATAPSTTQPASPASGRHWSPGKPRSPNTTPQRQHRLEHYRAGHLRRPRSALEAREELLVLALPGRCCSDVLQWTESEPRSRSACGPHLQRLVHVELPCLVHKVLAIRDGISARRRD